MQDNNRPATGPLRVWTNDTQSNRPLKEERDLVIQQIRSRISEAHTQTTHFFEQALLAKNELFGETTTGSRTTFTTFVNAMGRTFAEKSIAEEYIARLSDLEKPTSKHLEMAKRDSLNAEKQTKELSNILQQVCEQMDPSEDYFSFESALKISQKCKNTITTLTDRTRKLQQDIQYFEKQARNAHLLSENDVEYDRSEGTRVGNFLKLRSKNFIKAHLIAVGIQTCEIQARLAALREKKATEALATLTPPRTLPSPTMLEKLKKFENTPEYLNSVFTPITDSLHSSLQAIASADCGKFLQPSVVFSREMLDSYYLSPDNLSGKTPLTTSNSTGDRDKKPTDNPTGPQHVWVIPHDASDLSPDLRAEIAETEGTLLGAKIAEARHQSLFFSSKATSIFNTFFKETSLPHISSTKRDEKFKEFINAVARASAEKRIAEQYLHRVTALTGSIDSQSLKKIEEDNGFIKGITEPLSERLEEACKNIDAFRFPRKTYETVERAMSVNTGPEWLIKDLIREAKALCEKIQTLETQACEAVLLTENDLEHQHSKGPNRSKRFIEAHQAATEIEVYKIQAHLTALRVQQVIKDLPISGNSPESVDYAIKRANEQADSMHKTFDAIRASVNASLTAIAAADCHKFLYPPVMMNPKAIANLMAGIDPAPVEKPISLRTKSLYAGFFIGFALFVRNLIVKRLAFTALAPMVPAASVVIPVMSAAMTLSAVHVLYKKWCAKKPNEAPRPTGLENNNSKQKRAKTSQ